MKQYHKIKLNILNTFIDGVGAYVLDDEENSSRYFEVYEKDSNAIIRKSWVNTANNLREAINISNKEYETK